MAKKKTNTKVIKDTKVESKKTAKKKSAKKENFFKNVQIEMKKVRWPEKKEMIKYASATLAFILFFALFFLLSDGLIWGIKEVMR
jgi:preprotein translocase subunit SecE